MIDQALLDAMGAARAKRCEGCKHVVMVSVSWSNEEKPACALTGQPVGNEEAIWTEYELVTRVVLCMKKIGLGTMELHCKKCGSPAKSRNKLFVHYECESYQGEEFHQSSLCEYREERLNDNL